MPPLLIVTPPLVGAIVPEPPSVPPLLTVTPPVPVPEPVLFVAA